MIKIMLIKMMTLMNMLIKMTHVTENMTFDHFFVFVISCGKHEEIIYTVNEFCGRSSER